MRALVVLLFVSAPILAQDRPSVQITVPRADASAQVTNEPGGPRSPVVSSAGVLSSGQIRSLVANGFPARMHYKLEEWAVGRIFDNLRRTVEWDVVVKFDPLAKIFQAYRLVGDRAVRLGDFPDFNSAVSAAEGPYVTLMPPPKRGQRSYYSIVLEVESLSLTDLDEVERWLRGELKPAIRGDKNPGTAVSRGLGTLFVRLMGGDKRRYEARTGKFTSQ